MKLIKIYGEAEVVKEEVEEEEEYWTLLRLFYLKTGSHLSLYCLFDPLIICSFLLWSVLTFKLQICLSISLFLCFFHLFPLMSVTEWSALFPAPNSPTHYRVCVRESVCVYVCACSPVYFSSCSCIMTHLVSRERNTCWFKLVLCNIDFSDFILFIFY